MKLAQAAKRLSDTPLDGWDGTEWVEDVVLGSFQTFDRFVTERTFGQKKRIFYVGGDAGLPAAYDTFRAPDGAVFIIASVNSDIIRDEVYAKSYLLQQADGQVQIIDRIPTMYQSGMAGVVTETVTATVYGALDRYASEKDRLDDSIRLSIVTFTLPGSASVRADSLLRMDGIAYEVREVHDVLEAIEVKAIERGAA